MADYTRPSYLLQHLPTEIVDKGSDGFQKEGGTLLFIKGGSSYSLRFLTNPWDVQTTRAAGDWLCIRTVKTFSGLVGGGQFPRELRGTHIVFDQKVDERAGKRMTNPAWDPLIKEIAPDTQSKYSKGDRVEVTDLYGINVIDDEGSQRILLVSRTAGRSLMRALENKHAINGAVTATGSSWLVNFVFTPGKGYEAIVKRMVVEDEISLEAPEPLNVFDFMVERRQRLDDWMEQYKAGRVDAVEVEESSEVYSLHVEEPVAKAPVAIDDEPEAEVALSPAKLKLMLTEAGIKVPVRSDGASIRALAAEHGII